MDPTDETCTYEIWTFPGWKIVLMFKKIDIEKDKSCNHDFLQVLDGENGPSLTEKICGRRQVSDVMSTSNKIFIKFHSDGSTTGQGFKLDFRVEFNTGVRGTKFTASLPKTVTGAQFKQVLI